MARETNYFVNVSGKHCVEVEELNPSNERIGYRLEMFATKGDASLYLNSIRDGMPHENAMRKVASRVRSRENAKARNDAMRSVGMTKTRYGWE